MRKDETYPYLSPFALLSLAACGGGGGTDGVDTSIAKRPITSVEGKVQKGPLSNAFVFLDYNGDYLYDDGSGFNIREPSTRTDENGNFVLTTEIANYSLVATTDYSTFDVLSGTTLDGVTFKAPKSSLMLTPATTLMVEGNFTNGDLVSVLDFPNTFNAYTFDPFDENVDPNTALAVEKTSQQLMSVIKSYAAVLEGSGANQSDSYDTALHSLLNVMKEHAAEGEKLNFTNLDDLSLIKTELLKNLDSVENANLTAATSIADKTTAALLNVNEKIELVTDIGSVSAKNTFSTIPVLIEQIKQGTSSELVNPGTGDIEFANIAQVKASLQNQAPSKITLSNNTFHELSESLVIGDLETTDPDQNNAVPHSYAIIEGIGTDFAAFEINEDNQVLFKNTPNYESSPSFKLAVSATDSGGKSHIEIFSIFVVDDDEPSVIGGNNSASVTEDTADTLRVSGRLTVTDPDINDIEEFIELTESSGSAGIGYFSLSDNGEWTYIADNNQSEIQTLALRQTIQDSITVQTIDGVSEIITITIIGSNDEPVITGSYQATLIEDHALILTANGNLSVTDTDLNEAVFTEHVNTLGTNKLGYFTLLSDGSWTYSVDNAHAGVQALGDGLTITDSFNAVTIDGTVKEVTITIVGVDDAEIITGTTSGIITEDTSDTLTVTGQIIATDVDQNDYPAFVAETSVSGSLNVGTFQIDTSGFWTYSADNSLSLIQTLDAGSSIVETFTATTEAGTTQEISVQIHGVNEPIQLSNIGTSNDSGGFVINGSNPFDQSGRSLSSAGDVNGDGLDDIIVGAHRSDLGGYEAGASYIIFGQEGGNPVELSALESSGSNGFVIIGDTVSQNAALSVSGAGDINGDGFADLIIGAPVSSPNGKWSGSSYIVYGKNDTEIIYLSEIEKEDNTSGFIIKGLNEGDFFGHTVSDAGDVNGDGLDDLIIGAPTADPNGLNSGTTYVVYGRQNLDGLQLGSSIDLTQIVAGTGGFSLNGPTNEVQSGYAVSGAGDVNGDGYDDLIIGAPYADTNGSDSGTVFVIFGSAENTSVELSDLIIDGDTTPENGFVINGISPGDMSGYSVSSAGDVNGDGLDDLVIGAPGEATNGEMSGSSFVVFGKTDTEPVELSKIKANTSEIPAGFIINGANIFDSAGQSSVSNAGDVNGDGLDDLIVGAIGGDPNGTESGVSYVVFGKQSGQSVELSIVQNGIGGFSINGVQKSDNSGWSVSDAGDLNGDSFADVLVGVPFASPNGTSSGSSYAIFGSNITQSVTQVGTTGDDTLAGTTDNDIIFSGLGNDTIVGSPGTDRLAGGGGADIFVLSREDGVSTIIDFSPAEGDKVDLTNFGFANWADLQPSFSPSIGNNTRLTLDFDTILYFDNMAYDDFEEINFII